MPQAPAANPHSSTASPGIPARLFHRIGRSIVSQRIGPILFLACSLWFIFSAFRAGLLIACHSSLVGVSALNILRCLILGLRFDAVPIGFILIPLALVLTLVPNSAFKSRWLRFPVTLYCSLVIVFVLLVEIAGIPFFFTFASRINWIALDYLSTPREMLAYIWSTYHVVLLLLPPIIAFFGIFWLVNRLLWRGPAPEGPVWIRPFAAAGLLALCALMARGSVDHHPLRFGLAYFTSNQTLSQLTLNNLFTLGNAVNSQREDNMLEAEGLNLPQLDDARKVAATILTQTAPIPAGPRDLSNCNVVVILMESMGGRFVGSMGGETPCTPCLDALAANSLFLDNLYAIGDRTCRGISGVLCSHPDLTSQSLIKRSRALGRIFTLPDFFRSRGYRTMMFYGGNPDFDNMKGFLAPGGIENFYGEESLSGNLRMTWGYHDEVVFAKATEKLNALGDNKFFAFILTVSNHEPFTVPARAEMLPEDAPDSQKINACHYSDWALGQFFAQASKEPWFKNTIFVMVADHGRKIDPTRVIDVPGYRIPCLFYAPGLIGPKRISTVASQVDIAPTLLGLMNLPERKEFMGRDIRRVAPDDGFAFMHEADLMGFVRGTNLLIDFPGRAPILYQLGHNEMEPIEKVDKTLVERMSSQMLSYYRIAAEKYYQGTK